MQFRSKTETKKPYFSVTNGLSSMIHEVNAIYTFSNYAFHLCSNNFTLLIELRRSLSFFSGVEFIPLIYLYRGLFEV